MEGLDLPLKPRRLLPLYNLFIQLYSLGVRFASLWNTKAKRWVQERENLFEELEERINTNEQYIWMHCSSAGEFEQGKPVAEALRKEYPTHKLLISFFSPSGYEAAKNYNAADIICYLPLDTMQNATRFIQLVKPKLVVFVKYEFWYHHLSVAAFHHIPLLLVSAAFRKKQIFFKWHGRFFRQMLFLFRHIFVQHPSSLQLLQAYGINHCSISGDTRFDRVQAIVSAGKPVPLVDDFIQGKNALVAGSTWERDEMLLKKFTESDPETKLIIAPHEISKAHLSNLKEVFPNALLYSSFQIEKSSPLHNAQVLIIDSVGLLSRLYQHATLTYVGGGFTKDGIHNILEAAVWGKPVLFGPNHKKYGEAKELIAANGGFSITNAEELKGLADDLLTNKQRLQAVSKAAKNYVEDNTGATARILEWIQEKRLLTRL